MAISLTRKNVVANYVGRAAQTLLGLLVPPVLVRLMGIESYGLMGVYLGLVGILSILDMGLATTLQRELARTSVMTRSEWVHTRNFVRTIELLFWFIGIVACGLIALASSIIVDDWLTLREMPRTTAIRAIQIMSVCLLLQWSSGAYIGGLSGLQRQVAANGLQVMAGVLRSVGGLAVVWQISRTIEALFIWQALVMLLYTLASRRVFWRSVPHPDLGARFEITTIRANWRFSGGMWITSVLAAFLSQIDKVAATKILTLEGVGYYTLSAAVGASLGAFIGPVFSAVFPRLCQLVAAEDQSQLKTLYHNSCQLVSVILLPATVVLALSMEKVIYSWTGDPSIVANASAPARILAIGTAVNGLMNVPYGLQLASGWTELSVRGTMISAPLAAIFIWPLGFTWGATGLASMWAILNTVYLVISVHFMHRRLMKGEELRWWTVDVALPGLGAIVGAVGGRLIVPTTATRVGNLIELAAISFCALFGAALLAPVTRAMALRAVQHAGRVRVRTP